MLRAIIGNQLWSVNDTEQASVYFHVAYLLNKQDWELPIRKVTHLNICFWIL